jgi:hypothetical protein
MRGFVVALAAVATLFSSNAFCWNSRGHMMVAAVAWEQLNEQTRGRVGELLKLNPQYKKWVKDFDEEDQDQVAFVMAATWPDFIKKAKGYIDDGEDPSNASNPNQNTGYDDMFQHRYWHYVDLPFSRDSTPLIQPKTPNAKTQIEEFRNILESNASDDLKSYDLVWLLHLVGDAHQPLHATSRFSAASPQGDRGGNDVKLCEAPCRNELHAAWDAGAGSGTSVTAVITAAGKLDEAPSADVDETDVQTWVQESFELAKNMPIDRPLAMTMDRFSLRKLTRRKLGLSRKIRLR